MNLQAEHVPVWVLLSFCIRRLAEVGRSLACCADLVEYKVSGRPPLAEKIRSHIYFKSRDPAATIRIICFSYRNSQVTSLTTTLAGKVLPRILVSSL